MCVTGGRDDRSRRHREADRNPVPEAVRDAAPLRAAGDGNVGPPAAKAVHGPAVAELLLEERPGAQVCPVLDDCGGLAGERGADAGGAQAPVAVLAGGSGE